MYSRGRRFRPRGTIDYLKDLSEETGIPYQTLINLFLRDCAERSQKPDLRWTGVTSPISPPPPTPLSQRLHRLHACGPPGRHVAGDQPHEDDQDDDEPEHTRITGLDVEDHVRQDA
jgi:hypothetical protein